MYLKSTAALMQIDMDQEIMYTKHLVAMTILIMKNSLNMQAVTQLMKRLTSISQKLISCCKRKDDMVATEISTQVCDNSQLSKLVIGFTDSKYNTKPAELNLNDTSPMSSSSITKPKVSVAKKLYNINKNLDPKFKLAKVDIEEIQSSQTLQLGKWNREPNENFVVDLMKQERRREYWKRRIRQPQSKTAMAIRK